jgi:type I restriction enzyme R subunit
VNEYRLAEKPALDALAGTGWRVLSPGEVLAMRVEENRVLLKPVMIDALRTINGIGAEDAEAIYNDLTTLSDNEEWQRKLRGCYSRRLSGENRDRPVALIDFKNPRRNAFHVTNQFRVAAQRPRIPDIVLFVNGIPLVVIEAKSPLKGTATAGEAFEQIKQCERDIPRLFYPNAFNIVTDGMATLYGATGASSQFYAPWPDAWPAVGTSSPTISPKTCGACASRRACWTCWRTSSCSRPTRRRAGRSRRFAAISSSARSTRRLSELHRVSTARG